MKPASGQDNDEAVTTIVHSNGTQETHVEKAPETGVTAETAT